MRSIFKSFLFFTLMMVSSCETDDLSINIIPSIGFASPQGSILENNDSGLKVLFYSNIKRQEQVTIQVELRNFQNLQYGNDFTTDPAPAGNIIELTLDSDDTSPGFYVFPVQRLGAPERRTISFEIKSVNGASLQLGQAQSLTYTLDITKIQPVAISYDFNSCADFATPDGFTEAFEPGSKTDRGWGCRAFGLNSTRAPRASGFGGTAGDDKAWLIMNPVSIPAGATVTISYSVYSNFSGPGTISAKWSSDYAGSGNPLLANWTDLATLNNQLPAAGSKIWKKVEGTFTNISGVKVYLGIQFTGATNTSSASWDIDDFTFNVQ